MKNVYSTWYCLFVILQTFFSCSPDESRSSNDRIIIVHPAENIIDGLDLTNFTENNMPNDIKYGNKYSFLKRNVRKRFLGGFSFF